MKAIVANVLFGGILGCLSCADSTQANPLDTKLPDNKSVVFANFSLQPKFSIIPRLFNSLGNTSSVNSWQYGNASGGNYHQWLKSSAAIAIESPQFGSINLETLGGVNCNLSFCDREAYPKGNRPQVAADLLSSTKQPYIHQSSSANVVLGFQKTFWPSEKQGEYWGVTTVEQWGDNSQQLMPQSNYTDSPPILATGSSVLTFSGGGNHNLVTKNALASDKKPTQEFEDFRGGITYHRGVTKHLTMGVGFVYEDIFAGFTQLTYKSNILPITTTISLVADESDTDLHSHIRFQPDESFVVNYYHDGSEQKFDADLAIYPGLNLIARGNSKQNAYSTGIKVAIASNYFSLTATAALDREQNLQWQLNSQIGRFKFTHSNNKHKTDTELSNELVNSPRLGFQCSAFVKYQTRLAKQEQQDFVVWGGRFNSQTKIGENRHQWSFDLGYGDSPHGQGWIANSSVAIKPDLFLKLNYQEVSAVSDETKVKLELSSK